MKYGTVKVHYDMTGNPRKQGLEQYYTIQCVADKLVQDAIRLIGKDYKWVEPTAGKGAFIEALKKNGISDITSYDIEPKHQDVKYCDIINDTPDVSGRIAIGNPPFGRACNLAIKVFNALADKGIEYIAFIVPPSFRKTSILDRLHRNYHLIHNIPVPNVAFEDADGNPHIGGHLRTEFHIYRRRDDLRPLLNGYRSSHFRFVIKEDNPDIAIRTHGNNAGTVLQGLDYNPRTTAFIKLVSKDALHALNNADYSYWKDATSYIPCISPAEMSYAVDDYIKVHS
ncbi:hypothetical protein UFOVP210_20 [uncultured Caudovirales phage]|uniref:Uncharacterized protein n=1 Tax=uncultured Caudovirales phage TaxID=2100421 RepID=A0A6J7WMC9_9CAUD|nr:hypothetical protein UFOVP210_20 [uncultured Caudovirales phage]